MKTFTLVYHDETDEPAKIRTGLTEEDVLDIVSELHHMDYAILSDTYVIKSLNQTLQPDMMLGKHSTIFNVIRESVEEAVATYKPYSIRWKGFKAFILFEGDEIMEVGGSTPEYVQTVVAALNGAYNLGSQRALFETQRVMKNHNL